MKHSNISIFIPHVGCPHQCSFCDQRTISGAQHLPDGDEVREICRKALGEVKSPEDTEIAFFGGSFTAIPRDYMLELLTAASEFVGEGKFRGIRCSTRPDCISGEVLSILKKYGVTAIELGAQSMDDEVLAANERGHTSEDVRRACSLIKEAGFELGLQMMTGLYKSSQKSDIDTAKALISLAPDTLRIYPVVVLKGTKLAELYESGEYVPAPFDEMVERCAFIMNYARKYHEKVRIIKCGLHASEFVEQDMVAGYYHPAFRELCESMIYRAVIQAEIFFYFDDVSECRSITAAVNSREISKAVGQNRSNINYFRELGTELKIIGDERIPVYKCVLLRR
ncbi:MAG: radical SAM protein [Ruminococcus sp.]|nr:radical SAM protein [Ruminococcus sp.]